MTIYVTEGKYHTVIKDFVNILLTMGEPDSIEQVSCDMSSAFIKGVEDNLPNANIVFDRFHVSKVINKAVDKVRKADVVNNPILKGAQVYISEKPCNPY